jgi:hypothetical protein
MRAAIAAEITQGVITDVSQAIEWLKSTFFFVRYNEQISAALCCVVSGTDSKRRFMFAASSVTLATTPCRRE